MPERITAVAWVSRQRPDMIARSTGIVVSALESAGPAVSLCVAGDDYDNVSTGIRHIDVVQLRDRILRNLADDESSRAAVDFALYGDSRLSDVGIIDTGSNRNALLLALVGQRFLSIDDDVCGYASMSDGALGEVTIDPSLRHQREVFFKTRSECDGFVDYSRPESFVDFLTAHQDLLGRDTSHGLVAITRSGIHGDSGNSSPRNILLSRIDDADVYAAATRNRLLLQYVTIPIALPAPYFISMASGFDNTRILPPFMPLGRNQDGLFARVLRKVLPNSLIGFVPWVVRHDPSPTREYPMGEASVMRFRINEMVGAIVDDFKPTGAPEYEALADHLERYSSQDAGAFLASVRALCAPRLAAYVRHMRNLMAVQSNQIPAWRSDVSALCEYIEKDMASDDFCVPAEFLGRLGREDAVGESRRLVASYANLLRHWPAIRKAASLP
jgi:hypothetical protein